MGKPASGKNPVVRLFVYPSAPIDDWVGWRKLGGSRCVASRHSCVASVLLADVAERGGWEGVGAWYCSAVPDGDSFPIPVIAVKQDNNGSTFLICPQEMPWLDGKFTMDRTEQFIDATAWDAVLASIRPESE